MRFGRRMVKLTVLELGGKRRKTAAIRPRVVNPTSIPAIPPQMPKQDK